MLTNRRPPYQLILLILSAFVLFGVSLSTGSIHIALNDILKDTHNLHHDIFFTLRLPRTFCAFTCGGLLALAGALLQALLRNPLADPYILGVSSGAALLNLIALMLGFSMSQLGASALLGSLLAIGIVFGLNLKKQHSSYHLLLTGVMFASLCSALMRFLLNFSDNLQLRQTFFWLMGDLSQNTHPYIALGFLVAGLLMSLMIASALNVMVLGQTKAQTLGINTKAIRVTLYFLSAGLTAVAVTLAGPIGFIGLIIPHALRLIGLNNYYFLLPGCVFAGGGFLMLADTLGRSLLTPAQIPVGIITALVGAPIFLILLSKSGKEQC